MSARNARWQFWLDVGGTFTDCIAKSPDGQTLIHKTLSSGVVKGFADRVSTSTSILDVRRRDDPPNVWTGYTIRMGKGGDLVGHILSSKDGRFELDIDVPFETAFPYQVSSDESAPLVAIRYLLGLSRRDPLPPLDIRLGTTRGTNALLTRTGSSTAVLTTQGFGDLWEIGYQSRPELFTLDIQKPERLYHKVVEITERVAADGTVLVPCETEQVAAVLQRLLDEKIESLAICLLHATVNAEHEQKIARLARQLPFATVSVSHEISSVRKAVPRGDTTILDAYLTPILHDYLDQLRRHLHPSSRIDLMTSSGGLTPWEDFRGKDSILSGPAGGVVGVAHAARSTGFRAAIGFDMGGTSTDVSRWSGQFALEYETEKAGVRVVSPMMSIETVAAGGGSVCAFDGVKLVVGPASAGAHPGPACYGAGGPLAVTDVNFFLGRILPDAFPFDLDRGAVERHLLQQCEQIESVTGRKYNAGELAEGYRRVANTNMVEAIRCVTVDQGIDPREDILIAFGGAAAQHACAVAGELHIPQILIHPQAGILSALGIGRAEVTVHRERGLYRSLESFQDADWEPIFVSLRHSASFELHQKLPDHQVACKEFLDVRFTGLEEFLTIPRPNDNDVRAAYQRAFQTRHGYLPHQRAIEVVMARVIASAAVDEETPRSRSYPTEASPLPLDTAILLWEAAPMTANVFNRLTLAPGDRINGPAIVTEPTSTTIVDPGWHAEVLRGGELLLTCSTPTHRHGPQAFSDQADPVLLEIFNRRFEAIATQMGSTLRNTSRSVNVKERLDFSCAIFTRGGDLVVNAPHIPVHLGAMGATVRHILKNQSLEPGDVVVTNNPYQGGSHLPDVTVVTPVHDKDTGELLFVTASRAHHAEIGGITPGSMPPASRNLAEEGVLIPAMKVVRAGIVDWDPLRHLLQNQRFPSRDPETNLADIVAQIAANRHGADGLLQFVQDHSWQLVSNYMHFIQDAAEKKMRSALRAVPDGERRFVDYLDDGSPIALQLSIKDDTAHLDFHGTGPVLPGNLNANRAIVTAAVMYCLRCLLSEDIPLNQGVLAPITIDLPECFLNPPVGNTPERCAAVVGGNVETSQRIVDVILGAFDVAAASQGTMNNFLFGSDHFGYYETLCGGAGATRVASGADAVHTHMTNTRLTDVEVLESRFPVRLRQFGIRDGSGGAGQHRGGHGVIREVEFLESLQVSILSQRRTTFAPYGRHGGKPGSPGLNTLHVDGGVRELPGSISLQVQRGDIIRIETPGGGGWGAP